MISNSATHEAVVLSYSEAGRSRTVMLDPAEVPQVRAATQRYRSERARIEAAGNAGLAALLGRRAVTRKSVK